MVNIVSTSRRRRSSLMRLWGLVAALAVAVALQHIVVRTEVAVVAVTSRATHTPTATARVEDLVVSVNSHWCMDCWNWSASWPECYRRTSYFSRVLWELIVSLLFSWDSEFVIYRLFMVPERSICICVHCQALWLFLDVTCKIVIFCKIFLRFVALWSVHRMDVQKFYQCLL